jgi:hypothetical protein
MHGGDLEGVPVPEEEVATGLGFASAQDFRAWTAAGRPSGRCADDRCYWPALWPNLGRCVKCGGPVRLDKPGEAND